MHSVSKMADDRSVLRGQRLQFFGGQGAHLWLAHANGYPPRVYRAFVEQLQPHFTVSGYCHRPLWSDHPPPSYLSWRMFAHDMIETLQAVDAPAPWLVGHSMGATVATLAAAKRPDLLRGVVLIDPVFMPTPFALGMRLLPSFWRRRMPMIKKALGRPAHFESAQKAFDFHRGKRAFARFSDTALWDYVYGGMRHEKDGSVELAFSPRWEAAVYASVPWIWPTLKKLTVPTMVVRGKDSDTFLPEALAKVKRMLPHATVVELDGGHLLPMEKPGATATSILAYLNQQGH